MKAEENGRRIVREAPSALCRPRPGERSRNRKAANGAPEGERADRKARAVLSQSAALLVSAFRRSIPSREGNRETRIARGCNPLSDTPQPVIPAGAKRRAGIQERYALDPMR